MTLAKDQALCLRLRPYSETSQIVTLFGRQNGKIRAIAKGSKRPKSKFSGGLDLLNCGDILFYPPRGDSTLATLSEFVLQQSFNTSSPNVTGLYVAQFTAELLAQFTEDLDPHPALYQAAAQTWQLLQQNAQPASLLVNFELTLLQEVGLMPVWDACCACRRPLPANRRLYFTSSGGGMLCNDCEPAVYEKCFVEPQTLKHLRHPQDLTPPQTQWPAHQLLAYHFRELLGKESATMAFVNRLLAPRKVR